MPPSINSKNNPNTSDADAQENEMLSPANAKRKVVSVTQSAKDTQNARSVRTQ
jgi:hypothetical protein